MSCKAWGRRPKAFRLPEPGRPLPDEFRSARDEGDSVRTNEAEGSFPIPFPYKMFIIESFSNPKRTHVMTIDRRLTPDGAEEIAISGLAFLAGEPEALGRFLALAGIGPADLRTAAAEPGFLVGVLEFFLADESLLLAFSEAASIRPTMIAAARYALVGHYGME